MSYQAVKNGIVTTLLDATKAKAVYDYEQTKPIGYPCITVVPIEGDAEFLDTSRVRREYIFSIKCFQERLEVSPSEAERIMTALVDQIIAVFDSENNGNLQHSAIFTQPVKTKWGYLQVPDADVRSCEITLIAVLANASPFPYEPITDTRYNPILT